MTNDILKRDDYEFVYNAANFESFKERLLNVDNGLEFALTTKSAEKRLKNTAFINKDGSIDIEYFKRTINDVYEHTSEKQKYYESEEDYLIHEAFNDGAEERYYEGKGAFSRNVTYKTKKMHKKNMENIRAASTPEEGSILSFILKVFKVLKK